MTKCILENGPDVQETDLIPRLKQTHVHANGRWTEKVWQLDRWDHATDTAYYKFVYERDITDAMEDVFWDKVAYAARGL